MILENNTLSPEFEEKLLSQINYFLNHTSYKNARSNNKWLSITEAAKYAGVSYNTFIKFRTYGLKVCEIDGIKRVSSKEIDRFLEKHSF